MENKNKFKCYCDECNNTTWHEVLFEEKEKNEDIDNGIIEENKYMIIKCFGCDKISYRTESFNSEDGEYIDDGFMPYIFIKDYPLQKKGIGKVEDIYKIPTKIRKIYLETVEAICYESYILTAVGLRTLIEAICSNIYKKKTKLNEKINKLSSMGYISKSDASYLHGIRFMGNDATHDFEIPQKEQLILAIKIVEHLLETKYIFKNKAIEIMNATIEDYDDFIYLIGLRVKELKPGTEFTIKDLLKKDLRRIQKYDELINIFNADNISNIFFNVELVNSSNEDKKYKKSDYFSQKYNE